jgi:hypothetical protein
VRVILFLLKFYEVFIQALRHSLREPRKEKAVKLIITAALALLALYANFIAVNRLGRYAVEIDFYNKLSVAYDLAKEEGVRKELSGIKAKSRLRHELKSAAEFENNPAALKDTGKFISDTLLLKNKQARSLLRMRRAAIILIAVILLARFFTGRRRRKT